MKPFRYLKTEVKVALVLFLVFLSAFIIAVSLASANDTHRVFITDTHHDSIINPTLVYTDTVINAVNRFTLVNFDVSSIDFSSVESAELSLYFDDANPMFGDIVYRVIAPSDPVLADTPLGSLSLSPNFTGMSGSGLTGRHTFDITPALLDDRFDGRRLNLTIVNTDSGGAMAWRSYDYDPYYAPYVDFHIGDPPDLGIVKVPFGSNPVLYFAAWFVMGVLQAVFIVVSADALRVSSRALPWQLFLVGLLIAEYVQYAFIVVILYLIVELLNSGFTAFISLSKKA